jgi:hypothetical protein
MFDNYILTDAKVLSVNDSEKKRRIQVQPLPELEDVVPTTNCPWAIPFSSLNSSSIMENDLPQVNSIVRLIVRKDWKRFYYLNNRFFTDIFNFTTIQNKLTPISDLSNKDYQNLTFRLYKDGGLEFHNNQSGEHGYLHKSGAYSIFDTSGNLIINASGHQMSVSNASTISFTSTTSTTLSSPSVTITGGNLTTNGVAAPTGSGPYCGLPFCPVLSIPQSGNVVVGT